MTPTDPAPTPPGEPPNALETRLDEVSRAYARVLEDQKAFRARLEREQTRAVEAERAAVAQVLLEVADDLERALATVDPAAADGPLRALANGVSLTLGSLRRRLEALGVARLSLPGRPFDPREAEAVEVVEVGEPWRDGQVVREDRAGYRMGERILRPARVAVGRHGPPRSE